MDEKIIEQFSEIKEICNYENQKEEKIKFEIEELKGKISEFNAALKVDLSPKKLKETYAKVKELKALIEEKEYLLSIYGNVGSDLAKNTEFINKLIAFNEVFRKAYSGITRERVAMEKRFDEEKRELQEKHRKERLQKELISNEFFRMSLTRERMLQNFLNEFKKIHGVYMCDTDFIEGFWDKLKKAKEELRERELAEKKKETMYF
ncbi:TPA: hypothetical protein ACY4Q9_002991 [Clostridium perfringens]|uniref:Uncharacterized protein n=1 Tax=Clostridium perfringens TaxID=1502 RepID=A0AAW9KJ77_CLOPF|nr:hypothetical protein [Clostridium perfringens]MDZ4949191.1 hypothetical protein [Clostridium perfringens]MDZ7542188.1 hypothetical protein [Clostridium perfringens]